MTLGFTKSKVDSKLCFKVDVDDLFLTEKMNSLKLQEMKELDMMH